MSMPRSMVRPLVSILTGALCLAASSRAAWAVNLPEGAMVSLWGTRVADRPDLAGVIIEDRLVPLEINLGTVGTFRGALQNRVVREGSGTLTFYYRIMSDPGSTLTINALADYLTLPATRSIHVEYRLDGLGTVPPTTASRDSGRLLFSFARPIGAGEHSRFFFFQTNATTYALNMETIIAGESGPYAYMRSVATLGPVFAK